MCRRATVELEPLPQAALSARRFLNEVCERWELDGLRDELLLAVCELVTNSILHARTPIAVQVAVASGKVEVGVQDHDPQLPSPRMLPVDPSIPVGDSGGVVHPRRPGQLGLCAVVPCGAAGQLRTASGVGVRHLTGPWGL